MTFHHMTGDYILADNHVTANVVSDQLSAVAPQEVAQETLIPILQFIKEQRPDLRTTNLRLTKMQLREAVTQDQLIVNTINAIEELDKVANALVKRLREWYALYDPEVEHRYPDHKVFVETILASTAVRAEDTMGGAIAEADLAIMLGEAATVQQLYIQRDNLLIYLERIMDEQTPNLKAVAGPTIGAKLMAMAGSLQRLSRLPSSTIQLLGAETALFRHLRNKRSKPPKHGIIFNHQLLQRAPKPLRGKVARALADKISIATKIDYFKGAFIGDKLYKQVEEKTA